MKCGALALLIASSLQTTDQFVTKMFETNPDFVFTVTRDFVRSCQNPILVLPDDVPAHPYAVAMECAMLAPKAGWLPQRRPGSAWDRARTRPESARLRARTSAVARPISYPLRYLACGPVAGSPHICFSSPWTYRGFRGPTT